MTAVASGEDHPEVWVESLEDFVRPVQEKHPAKNLGDAFGVPFLLRTELA
jgi:hypothetical protein